MGGIHVLTPFEAVAIVKRKHKNESLCAVGDNFTCTIGADVEINNCFRATIKGPGKLWAVGQYSVAVSTHPKGEVIAVHEQAKTERFEPRGQLSLI